MPYRILWALPYLPWPISSGGKLRQFQLIKTLALRGHHITLLAQSKYPLTPEIEAALKPYVAELVVLPRRSLKHPLSLLLAAIGHLPMLASVNGYSRKLTQTFEELLAKNSFDVIQIEHSYGLQPFLGALKRLQRTFMLTEHNVESRLIPATYQHLPALLKPYKFLDTLRYRRWEKYVLQQATRVAAVTREDADVMSGIAQRPVDVVINGVDVAYYANVTPDYTTSKILFVGNMEYPPNLDAVHLTVEQIMPKVWQTCPQAELVVCGYGMPAEWAQRWPDPRLHWKGFVPDIRTEQADAAAFIVALREGGGSKLKVLEAMAAGLPIVSTTQGVSGLAAKATQDYLLGDTMPELANGLVKLLQDSAQAKEIGQAGRRYVETHHDWSVAADQLEHIYQDIR